MYTLEICFLLGQPAFLSFPAVLQWKKYWFVLSADSLRYYKDSIAEEVFYSLVFVQVNVERRLLLEDSNTFFSSQASDLEGEIDLSKCYNVSEYQVQRNYGFQIHVRKLVPTPNKTKTLKSQVFRHKCNNEMIFFISQTPNGVYTLSAMTSGIRKNWIQALMKNVHPGHAPDVAR